MKINFFEIVIMVNDQRILNSVSPSAKPTAMSSTEYSLTIIAIVAGILTIGIGYLFLHTDPNNYSLATIIICVGLAITLSAFGATAAGKWNGWTLGGSIASTIVLYLVLQSSPRVIRGYIFANIDSSQSFHSIEAYADKAIFVGRATVTDPYRLILFPDHIKSNFFYLLLRLESSNDHEKYIGCIPTKLLSDAISAGEDINFQIQFDQATKEPTLFYPALGKSIGIEDTRKDCERNNKEINTFKASMNSVDPRIGRPFELSQFFLSAAWADASYDSQVGALLPALESELGDERENARSTIAKLGVQSPDAWKVVSDSWKIGNSSYRADLGRLVAWVSAIHDDRRAAFHIFKSLNTDQIKYLTLLLGYNDKTIRAWSTELISWFLQTTGWQTTQYAEKVDALISGLSNILSFDDDARKAVKDIVFDKEIMAYNSLISIKDASCDAEKIKMQLLLPKIIQISATENPPANRINTVALAKQTVKSIQLCK